MRYTCRVIISTVKRLFTRFSPVGLIGFVAYYGVVLYLAMAFAAYGLAWREFRNTQTKVLSTGGRSVEGKVVSLSSWGVGESRDYFLKLDNWREEFMIPASILNPIYSGNRGDDFLELSDRLREGDRVYVGASGTRRPVVLELRLTEREGREVDVTLLNYRVSAQRFRQTMGMAPAIGNRWLMIALVLVATALMFHGLYALGTSRGWFPRLTVVGERLVSRIRRV